MRDLDWADCKIGLLEECVEDPVDEAPDLPLALRSAPTPAPTIPPAPASPFDKALGSLELGACPADPEASSKIEPNSLP